MKTTKIRSLFCLLLIIWICSLPAFAQARRSAEQRWPRPVPVRIGDGSNKDLLVMTKASLPIMNPRAFWEQLRGRR